MMFEDNGNKCGKCQNHEFEVLKKGAYHFVELCEPSNKRIAANLCLKFQIDLKIELYAN